MFSSHLSRIEQFSGKAGNLTAGLDYDVWVTTEFADGTKKSSEVRRVRMLAAANPSDFAAAPFGPASAKLTWSAMPGATHYMVNGSGLQDVKVTDTTVTAPNIGPGNHEWTLIAVYGSGRL